METPPHNPETPQEEINRKLSTASSRLTRDMQPLDLLTEVRKLVAEGILIEEGYHNIYKFSVPTTNIDLNTTLVHATLSVGGYLQLTNYDINGQEARRTEYRHDVVSDQFRIFSEVDWTHHENGTSTTMITRHSWVRETIIRDNETGETIEHTWDNSDKSQ